MTTLRALVGAGSALALLGFVVLAPLGWTVILIAASPEKPVEAPARQTCQGDVTPLSVHSPPPKLGLCRTPSQRVASNED